MAAGVLPHEASWPFVGREDELEWAAVARRERRCSGLIVSGAAGVGKTRLAREVLAAAATDRCVTEWVQATQAAASVPFGAFAALVPFGAPSREPVQLFQLCAEALRERARSERLVLGVDDAHLLDATSAALVLHLAVSETAFVLATVRAGERCPDSIVALWKDLGAPRLELQQLSADETAALIETVLRDEVAPDVSRWAYAMSDGNVLYLRELLKSALSGGALVIEEGLWRLRSRPETSPALVELISSSLEGLGEGELDTARLLAFGEPLELDTVLRWGGADPLSRLEARGLAAVVAPTTSPVGRHEVRLSHPLYGEVLRDATPTVRGMELRVRLAEAVRAGGLERPGDALRVATWLEDAGVDLDDPLLLAAAIDANAGGDPDLAERLVQRTGPALDAAGVGVLARAPALRRRFAEAEAILAEWEGELTTEDAAVSYLLERALRIQHQGLRRTDDALGLLDRASAWFEGTGWRERVDSIRLMVLATNRGAGPSQVIEAAERVLADADLASDIRRLASLAYALSLHDVGRSADALSVTQRLQPTVPLRDDADVYAFSVWTMVRLEAGYEWDRTEQWLHDADRDLSRVDDPLSHGQIAVALSQFALARGRPDTAVRRARESIAYMPRPDPSRRLPTLAWLCLVVGEAMRGDVRAALDADAGYRASIAEAPVGFLQPQEIVARAALVLAEGDLHSAGRILMEGAAANEGMLMDQAHLLYAALRAGVAPAAVVAQLDPIANAVAVPLVLAFASHARGLASRDAVGLLAAADAFAEIGAVLWAAEAAGQAAVAHSREGRDDSARRARALSGELYASCEGARSAVLDAVDLAPVGLTGRELEITTLAANGASNAEIAARLVLSVRTVESHMYRAMRKLGVSNREELRRR
jgi:DNA-binding CsgD family transcriptional regulator